MQRKIQSSTNVFLYYEWPPVSIECFSLTYRRLSPYRCYSPAAHSPQRPLFHKRIYLLKLLFFWLKIRLNIFFVTGYDRCHVVTVNASAITTPSSSRRPAPLISHNTPRTSHSHVEEQVDLSYLLVLSHRRNLILGAPIFLYPLCALPWERTRTAIGRIRRMDFSKNTDTTSGKEGSWEEGGGTGDESGL